MVVGKKVEKEEGGYKMDIKSLSKEENKISFLINGISPYLANALRRTIMEDVPVLAIEEVEFNIVHFLFLFSIVNR